MDKQSLLEHQDKVKAGFDSVTNQIGEAESHLKQLSEEQYRLQGEYRLLEKLIDETTQTSQETVEGEVVQTTE